MLCAKCFFLLEDATSASLKANKMISREKGSLATYLRHVSTSNLGVIARGKHLLLSNGSDVIMFIKSRAIQEYMVARDVMAYSLHNEYLFISELVIIQKKLTVKELRSARVFNFGANSHS